MTKWRLSNTSRVKNQDVILS